MLLAAGVYLLLASQSRSEYVSDLNFSHLKEIILGFLAGVVTIFLLYLKPERKADK